MSRECPYMPGKPRLPRSPIPAAPPSFDSDTVGCPLPIGTAINAKWVKTKIGGVTASDLRFTVPQNLKHPLTGVDNSIRQSVTTINRKVKTVGGKS